MAIRLKHARAALVFSVALACGVLVAGCPVRMDLMSEFQPGSGLGIAIVGTWQVRYVEESTPSGTVVTFKSDGTVAGLPFLDTFEIVGDDAILFRAVSLPSGESHGALWQLFGINDAGEWLFVQYSTDQSVGPFVLTPISS